MSVSVELLTIVGGFVLTLAAFLYTRFHEAENRGRLMQRVDELEKAFNDMRERTKKVESDVSCHDADLSTINVKLETIEALVEKIDAKLDRLAERREHERRGGE